MQKIERFLLIAGDSEQQLAVVVFDVLADDVIELLSTSSSMQMMVETKCWLDKWYLEPTISAIILSDRLTIHQPLPEFLKNAVYLVSILQTRDSHQLNRLTVEANEECQLRYPQLVLTANDAMHDAIVKSLLFNRLLRSQPFI